MSHKRVQTKATSGNFNWFVFIFLTAILAYSPFAIDPVLQIRYVAHTAVCLVGLLLLFRKKHTDKKINLAGLPFYVIWLIYWCISVAGVLVMGNRSGDGYFIWFQIFLFGAMPFILSALFYKSEHFIELVIKVFLITGLITIIIGIFQLLKIGSIEQISHASLYEVTSLFAHKNIFAEILLLVLPMAIISIIKLKKIWKFLGYFESVLCCALIIILLSRAVWLSFTISFGITLIIILLFNKFRPVVQIGIIIKKIIVLIIVFLVLAISCIVLFSSSNFKSSVKNQFRDLVYVKAFANKDRLGMWARTVKIGQEYPFTGIGMGNWKIEILKEGNKNLQSEDNTTFFQRPHNDYLWIMAEQGMPALFLFLFAFGIILLWGYRLALVQTTLTDRLFYVLLNFGVVAYLVFSFFSFPKERVEHMVLLGFIISIIIIKYHQKFGKEKYFLSGKLITGVLVILILTLIIGVSRYKSEMHLRKAYEARAQGYWVDDIDELGKAHTSNFKMDFVSTPIAWYKGEAFFNLHKVDEAYKSFIEAKKVNPYHMHVLNNLGTCYELKGNHDSAIYCFNAALTYTGYFEDPMFNLCAVYYNIKDNELSISTLQKIKPDSKDERYQKFSKAIVERYLSQLIDTTADVTIKKYLVNIRADEKWYRSVLEKSITNKRSFKKQLLLDIIWIIANDDKDEQLAAQLKKKYYI